MCVWLSTEVEDHCGRSRVGCALVGIQWETEAQGKLGRWMSTDSG